MHHDFIAMITRVHDKMGTCGVAKMTNYQLVGNTAGTMCYLSYVRHCENGDLSEDFQWQITGGKAVLQAYGPKSGF